MNITFCVVLYKVRLYESETIRSLLASKDVLIGSTILLFDNSPTEQKSDNFIEELNRYGIECFYYYQPENLPLSKTYNRAIDFLKDSDSDYLCLLDQDSNFTGEFLLEVDGVISSSNPSLILPKIYFKSKMVSPTKKFFLKGFYLNNLASGFYGEGNLSAINSGMIFSKAYLLETGFRYDEHLSFYGTDDYFMMKFNSYGFNPYVLNYKLEHDLTLSTLNKVASNSLLKSYRAMIDAWHILYQDKNFFIRTTVKVYSVIHNFYMALRYRNLGFLCFLIK